MCALRFFYQITLGRKWMVDHIPFPKHAKKLPVVLSTEQIAAFFGAFKNLKHRTILMTMTMKYAHLAPVHRTRAIEILDKAFQTDTKTDTVGNSGTDQSR